MQRQRRERIRERDNWRVYDATEFGQWNEEALRLMVQEGRPPSSYNFTKRYVDTIAGSIIADPFDVNFDTELGDKNDISILLETLYLEDRELGNWNHEYLQFIRAGFIYRGWLEFYVDRSRDPRGRVGLRYISGDRVVTDPDWTTHKVKDNKAIYVWSWMTAEQIKDKYHKKTDEIENAIRIYESSTQQGDTLPYVEKLFDRSPEFWDQQNGQYLVFDKYELKKVSKKRIFDSTTAQFLPDLDPEDSIMFLESAQMLGRPVEIIPETQTICKVRTLAPALSLDLVLQDGKHPIQTGDYPMACFASDVINGRPNTPVDQLKDPQISFNKRESTITHILMTTNNNALLIESDAVEQSEDAHKIGKERNRPGAYFIVEPGAATSGKIKMMDKNAPPADFMNAAENIRSIMQEITPAVPAMQGVGEEGDSGVYFQAKVAQAQIGMQIPSKFMKAAWQEIGDKYFFAAQQIYTYPMAVSQAKKNRVFTLNMPGGVDLADIPRMRVTVTQTPTSETYRRQMLQQYVAINQYLPDPLTKTALARIMVGQLPNIPDDDLQELENSARLSEELQKLSTMAQIMQLKSQIMMGQQQMAMAGGGGFAPGAPGNMPPVPSGAPAPPQTGGAPGAFLQQTMGPSAREIQPPPPGGAMIPPL